MSLIRVILAARWALGGARGEPCGHARGNSSGRPWGEPQVRGGLGGGECAYARGHGHTYECAYACPCGC
eukprot:8708962-Alexandrium_andersonii.AAC.1